MDAAGDAIPGPGGGGHSSGPGLHGGGGGHHFGFDLPDGGDEFFLVIAAIIVAAVVLFIAVPLGLLAIELVLALVLIGAGIVARLLRVKPWKVLVRRDQQVVGVIAVRGWRSSRAIIAALRSHLA